MKLTAVVGAATPPGRLAEAVASLVAAAAARSAGLMAETVNLADAGVEICDGRKPDEYGAATRQAVARIAAADLVVLASPVYRASYTGVLKNLLDLLPVEALRDKPVGIVAMGASPHHYLGVDHGLRAVLAWFGALTVPNSVYLTNADFAAGRLAAPPAIADLEALAATLLALGEMVKGRSFGPTPLAAKFT